MTSIILLQLKLQLLECPPRTDHREALLAGASCRSEVALHSEAVCTDYPYDARRPVRHLLHPISGIKLTVLFVQG